MEFAHLLRRVAAARGGTATIILELPDGNEIACRDEWQAMVIEELLCMMALGQRDIADVDLWHNPQIGLRPSQAPEMAQ